MLLGWLIMYARRRQRDRLAEARLRDSEERWKFALEGAGDGVWDANLVSRSTAYSRRWKQILGYEEHEVSSDPDEWSQRIHPDDRERVLADNQRCIDGGVDGFTIEFRMRAKDGRWIWVLDRGKVVSRGSDGRALRMIGTHTDISDRKRSEHALRDSEERLQRALEASRLALWDLDLTTGDVFLSDEWSEMLGGPRIPTRTTFEALTALVPEDDRGKIALAMGEALRGVTSGYLVEHRVNRPDGQAFWVRSQGRVVERDANGRVRRAVGTNRDITERQLARATQLHLEARLREAQKLEAIGTLAGGIAHDFNNIMAAILGNVALARQDVAPDHPAQRYLEQINKAGQRARSLVEQILAFSRKQPGEFGSHSLRPIVEETIAMLRSMISKDTTLRQNLTEQALRVNCNPTQLQQVLLNLGNNAWQALPAGKGLIEIGLDETVFATGEVRMPSGLEPGAYAHLWVRDEGSGMDEETRLHIFEPFFTTKLVGKGTGLGLAVVHGIVESHGGAVDVSTALGKGSTFHVYLPVVDDESAAMPLAAQDPAGTSEGHGQRVLYLDDDEVMTVMVHSLLQRLGYRATCMLDAREALALVERDPDGFDLVVTDFNMPGLSGLDVARRLAEVRPGLPVVISSGYISDALRTESVELGVRAVMRKEHTFEELGAVVRSSLSAFDRAGPPYKVS
jgi:PAS domain S-box-containing protein